MGRRSLTDYSNRILVADDEPHNLELLQLFLEEKDYLVETASDGQAAWEKLTTEPDRYMVVLLDRMMPNMSGLEVLKKMKQDVRLCKLPVVLQTALSSTEDVTEGISAGAYYYLGKPYERSMLHSVVDAAASDYHHHRKLVSDLQETQRTLEMLSYGVFSFSTLDEAQALALLLAKGCSTGPSIVSGLAELFVNAVEHGNLNISYEEKSRLLEEGTWRQEIESRLLQSEYRDRKVIVEYRKEPNLIEFLISDEGQGFDWQKYLEIDPSRGADRHGRGIAMAKMISFSRLEYLGVGNQVKATVNLELD